MPKLQIFNVAKMFFNAIRENKILEKISEFTVLVALYVKLKINTSKTNLEQT